MDVHSAEQAALLERYYLRESAKQVDARWHANGPHSVSPFVPCASGRIPVALRAARLTSSDVLWDLGCGDGRILLQAAAQYGCTCVGLDIDAACVADARAAAAAHAVDDRCTFLCADMMAFARGSLCGDGGWTTLGAAAEEGLGARRLRAPTAVLLFITSHGLCRLSDFLFGEWSRGAMRVLTCVENPNECFDFEAEDALFGGAGGRPSWPVSLAYEEHGIYVVPPCGVEVSEWERSEPMFAPTPPLGQAAADATEVGVLRGLLSDEEMRALLRLGARMQAAEEGGGAEGEGVAAAASAAAGAAEEEGGGLVMDWSAAEDDIVGVAEDAIHSSYAHRVVHLHRGGEVQKEMPRLLERLLSRIYAEDAQRWKLLLGRPVSVRSVELHTYRPGGSVADPQHRDSGSLLTLSVLLSEPSSYTGAKFTYISVGSSEEVVEPQLSCGDGVLFVSEKRHNVSTLETGVRHSFIIELWEGPATRHNRHH
ncbi:hypothetical protein AB1Y20_014607 [Prymnesium parvum]|uniref:Methyltransferase domain-containing protein n=1 Tax=Prymnesium parvum TaxID=97485 RepID=A0AB34IDT0_PRYPA